MIFFIFFCTNEQLNNTILIMSEILNKYTITNNIRHLLKACNRCLSNAKKYINNIVCNSHNNVMTDFYGEKYDTPPVFLINQTTNEFEIIPQAEAYVIDYNIVSLSNVVCLSNTSSKYI
jgi:hypothetical protein